MGLFTKKIIETIIVDGMKCSHCSQRVVDALKNINVKATVSLESKMVEVSYHEGKTTLEEIKKVITDLGFVC